MRSSSRALLCRALVIRIAVAFLLFSEITLPSHLVAQTNPLDQTPSTAEQASQQPPEDQRPVSWKSLLPNIADDQRRIWLFPARLNKKRNWIPTAAILATTAALIALDPHDAPYFRRTSSFGGFNSVFTGNGTTVGMVLAPVSLYAAGLARRDSKMQATALLVGEAVADSEILATVLKDATKRVRPAALSPGQNFWDTWFESKGSFLRGNGSMPSGHTIVAFSVATIVARRYGNQKWVPYVSYGMAALVGLSRITLSAHFISDVFVGGALGYSVSRFAVLRQ
jgi:membrane-associated phospholipid phosphatase